MNRQFPIPLTHKAGLILYEALIEYSYGLVSDEDARWTRKLARDVAIFFAVVQTTQICAICGCTDDDACGDEETDDPCQWAGPELCSRCVTAPAL